MSKYKNLDYVVALVQNDLRDYGTASYVRYLQFAINGYRELNLAAMPNIKVEYIELDDNYMLELPKDFIDYTAIAVVVQNRLVTLTLNNRIPLARKKDECGELIVQSVTSGSEDSVAGISPLYGYYFPSHFRNGQYVGEAFSMGGGFNSRGYYRLDYDNNRIQFSNVVPNKEIVLEYKADVDGLDGASVLPLDLCPVLQGYVHYMLRFHDKRESGGRTAEAYNEYMRQFRMYRRRKFAFTIEEFLDSKYRTIKSTPKR